MIVRSCFEGDGHIDHYVMWKQHDLYYGALRLIVSICQEHFQEAYNLVGGHSDHWEPVERFDHCMFQQTHDVLAAVWRFRYEIKVRQMKLPGCSPCKDWNCPWGFEGQTQNTFICPRSSCTWLEFREEPDIERDWTDWLVNEVRSWKQSPHLVRYVIRILKNQNNPVGLRCQDTLISSLLDRFDGVPWTQFVLDRLTVDQLDSQSTMASSAE